MVKTILLDSFLLFLLVYALMDLSSRAVRFFEKHLQSKAATGGYWVQYLRSGGRAAEATVREALIRSHHQELTLVLVDLGLTDEERAVAETLCREYGDVPLLNREEYLRFAEHKTASFES